MTYRESLLRDIFYEDDGKWKVEFMNIDMLKRYHLYDGIIDSYNGIKCNVDDWIFAEKLCEKYDFKLQNAFYTVLWIIAYYQKDFNEWWPMEWYNEIEEKQKEIRETEIKKLQEKFRSAFNISLPELGYDPIIMEGNTDDTRKTGYTISSHKNRINEIIFVVNGIKVPVKDELIIARFNKILKTEIINYKTKEVGPRRETKKKAIHTHAIERMVNLAKLLQGEKVFKSDNMTYGFIAKLLGYYGFKKLTNRIDQDANSQIKNTLKKVGFIPIKNRSR